MVDVNTISAARVKSRIVGRRSGKQAARQRGLAGLRW